MGSTLPTRPVPQPPYYKQRPPTLHKIAVWSRKIETHTCCVPAVYLTPAV